MTTLTASKARIPPDAFKRVVRKGERLRIRHRSGATAVLISEEELAFFEALEEREDLKAYRKAKRQWLKDGRKTVPWEKVKAELGL